MAATRYNGPLDDMDLSDLTGVSAPSNNPPAPPTPPAQPAPQQPAPNPNPSENNNGGDGRRRGWGNWVLIGVAAVVIAVVMWLWGIPWIQSHLSNPSDPSPSSSQSGDPTGSQSPDPNNSQNGDDDSDKNGGQNGSKLSVAEQAALLDPWFDGIPERNWETKTTAELGVDPTTPLGSFAKNFCVVLSDGTVIARGTSETGDSIPTIITDYTVPDEWNGTAVVLAEDDFNTVLLISKLPENTNQELTGTIWHFEAAEGTYAYQGKGHTTPPATE